MSVPAAYLGIIIIWTTTPLAIKWSSEGTGFLFGVTSRITLSAIVALLLVRIISGSLPWNRSARKAYVAAGTGIYTAMLCVYWGSRFIPSGWVSVIFGMSPVFTGLLASIWLGEKALTVPRLAGMVLGLLGLGVIFGSAAELGIPAISGIAAIVLSALFHSLSAVWVKRIDAELPALSLAGGGLLVAAPLYLVTWLMVGGEIPDKLPLQASLSILYLALFGSVFGFVLYYYILKNMEVTRTALITLITPVSALFLGNLLNGEALSDSVWLGTVLILAGLACHEYGDSLLAD